MFLLFLLLSLFCLATLVVGIISPIYLPWVSHWSLSRKQIALFFSIGTVGFFIISAITLPSNTNTTSQEVSNASYSTHNSITNIGVNAKKITLAVPSITINPSMPLPSVTPSITKFPSPTPVITATPKITATPSPIFTPVVTPTPTQQTQSLNITITQSAGNVNPGDYVTESINTSPNAYCTIEVDYYSGPSKASGLYPQNANSAGDVSWNWKIGTRTYAGRWPINIICSLNGVSNKIQDIVNVL